MSERAVKDVITGLMQDLEVRWRDRKPLCDLGIIEAIVKKTVYLIENRNRIIPRSADAEDYIEEHYDEGGRWFDWKDEPDRPWPKIVCLCGSTRFMEAFFEAGWDFTLKGYIVLSIGVCKITDKDGAHGAEALGKDVAERLDELHLRKIDLADEVFVLNVGGYIGESTGKEIAYAQKIGKPISYLEISDGQAR